jgi:chromosomal replication initiation ATPase DnaA
VVCNAYAISVSELTSPNTTRGETIATEPKMLAIYLIKSNTFYSGSHIAALFGYQKSCNTNNAVDWVQAKVLTDHQFKRFLNKIEAILPLIFNIHK